MGDLKVRLISALALAAVGLTSLVGHPLSRAAFLTLLLVIGAWEFSRLVNARLEGPRADWVAGALAALLLLPRWPAGFPPPVGPEAWLWGSAVLAVFVYVLLGFRFQPIERLAPWVFLQTGGCLLLGLWGGHIFLLFAEGPGWQASAPFLLVLLSMVVNDSGAYFTGRAVGRRKLCPQISAKKTVEGAAGGAACTMLVGLLLGPAMAGLGWISGLVFGLIMAFTGVCGDLLFSSVKRYAGVKDASRLIPGHGGVLDRFDSILLSAPVAVLYLGIAAGNR